MFEKVVCAGWPCLFRPHSVKWVYVVVESKREVPERSARLNVKTVFASIPSTKIRWPCDCLIFSCDQAALWMVFSVRLSLRPSVCHTFSLCSHHRIIMKFSEVITNDQSEVHGQGHKGQNPNEPFPDCNSGLNSHMMMKWYTKLDVVEKRFPIVFQGHPSNFKTKKNRRFWPKLGVSGL